jgi:hypothetical protein
LRSTVLLLLLHVLLLLSLYHVLQESVVHGVHERSLHEEGGRGGAVLQGVRVGRCGLGLHARGSLGLSRLQIAHAHAKVLLLLLQLLLLLLAQVHRRGLKAPRRGRRSEHPLSFFFNLKEGV